MFRDNKEFGEGNNNNNNNNVNTPFDDEGNVVEHLKDESVVAKDMPDEIDEETLTPGGDSDKKVENDAALHSLGEEEDDMDLDYADSGDEKSDFIRISSRKMDKQEREQEDEDKEDEKGDEKEEKDGHTMPPCAERSLVELITYLDQIIQTLKASKAQRLHDKAAYATRVFDKASCLKKIKRIQSQFIKEEHHLPGANRTLNDVITKLDAQDFSKAKALLSKVLRSVRPLDFSQTIQLVQSIQSAADGIKDRDVVLLIGFTGAGKSSTIHYLAGSEMQFNKAKRIYPAKIKPGMEEALSHVNVSHNPVSETRHVSVVPVTWGRKKHTLSLCDTPGFGDVRGPEIDISNSVAAVEAFKQARSVRIAVLIPQDGLDDRLMVLRDLIRILVGMLDITQYVDSFAFLFSKFKDEEAIQLQTEAILKFYEDEEHGMTPEERGDEAFEGLVYALTEQIGQNGGRLMVVDPLDKKGVDTVLNRFLKLTAIKNPKRAFVSKLSPISFNALRAQLECHGKVIRKEFLNRNFKLVHYKLSELKQAKEGLGSLHDIGRSYDASVKEMMQCMLKQYEEAVQPLDRVLEEGGQLNQTFIERYRALVQYFKQVEDALSMHFSEPKCYSEMLIQRAKFQAKTLVEGIQNVPYAMSVNYLTQLKKQFDNLRTLVLVCGDMQFFYTESRQLFDKHFSKHLGDTRQCVDAFQYDKVAKQLGYLEQAQSLMRDHFLTDKAEIEKRLTMLRVSVLKKLKQVQAEMIDLLNVQHCLDMDALERLKIHAAHLEEALDESALHVYVSKSEIKILYANLVDVLVARINQSLKRIDQQFEKDGDKEKEKDQSGVFDNVFGSVKEVVRDIDASRKISAIIEEKTETNYASVMAKLSHFTEKIGMTLKALIPGEAFYHPEKHPNIDFEKIGNLIAQLDRAAWLDALQDNICQKTKEEVQNYLLQYLKRLGKLLTDLDLGKDKIQHLEHARTLLELSQRVRILQYKLGGSEFFETVDQIITTQEVHLKKTIQTVLSTGVDRIMEACDEQQGNDEKRDVVDAEQNESEAINFLEERIFSSVQDLFMYMSTASKAFSFCSAGAEVLEHKEKLVSYVAQCSKQLEKTLSFRWHSIFMAKGDLNQHARKISLIISKFQRLQAKQQKGGKAYYDLIFDYFDDKLVRRFEKKMQQDFSEFKVELEGLLTAKNRLSELEDKSSPLKVIHRIETYFGQTQYGNLYVKIYKYLQRQGFETGVNLEELLSRHDYSELAEEFERLCQLDTQKGLFEKLRKKVITQLEESFSTLIMDTSTIPDDPINLGKIKNIVKYVEHMEQVKLHIGDYLDKGSQGNVCYTKKISTNIGSLTKALSRRINGGIAALFTAMQAHNFVGAEKIQRDLQTTGYLMSKFCEGEPILEELGELDVRMQAMVDEIVKQCDVKGVSQYSCNESATVCEKLKEASTQNQLYRKARDRIRTYMVENVKAEMAQIEDLNDGSTRNSRLDSLKTKVESFPEDIKKQALRGITRYEEALESSDKARMALLQSAKKKTQKELAQLFESGTDICGPLKDIVKDRIDPIVRRIYSRLAEHKFSEIFDDMIELSSYDKNLGGYVPRVRESLKEVEERRAKAFNRCATTFTKSFTPQECITSTCITSESVGEQLAVFEKFVNFVTFQHRVKQTDEHEEKALYEENDYARNVMDVE